jgi:hypothetical protein
MTCCTDYLRAGTALYPNLLGPLPQSTKALYLAHLLLLPQDLLPCPTRRHKNFQALVQGRLWSTESLFENDKKGAQEHAN